MEKFTLKEAVLKDPELGEAVWRDDFETKALRNPVYKKALKEGLYSDVAGALGGVQDTVWNAAWAKMIGRQVITVIPTANSLERFPREIAAYAFEGEGPVPDTGGRIDTVDIQANHEFNSKKEWSQSFAEDASFNVLQWQIGAIGRAIAKIESQKIIALYTAIANASLATGAEITVTDGAPTWAQIVDLINAVNREDFDPVVVAMNPHEFGGLLKLDQFISSLYKSNGDLKGVFHSDTLDVTFVSSSLITKSLAVDINAAAAMILRRDVQAKPYEDPGRNMYGVLGSERVGYGVIRTKAVARGTN
jgi:hypothetical protein